VAITDNK